MSDATQPQPSAAPGGLTPSLRVLIGLAAAVVLLAGVSFAREIIGPLAVAAVIVVICNPLRRPLDRMGLPSWISTTIVIVVSWLVLLVLAALLAFSIAEFTQLAIAYAPDLRETVDSLIAQLGQFGLNEQASDAIAEFFTPAAIVRFATSLGGSLIGVLTALFFIFAYTIFMSADAARYGRAEKEYGSAATPRLAKFRDFNDNVRRYYIVNAIFGLIVAAIDGLALSWMGIPAPLVWAVLSFVTNFIPNIGFIIGLIPPMLLGLVVGGWPLMLGVIIVYILANVVLQVLVQPKFVSDAVSLSLTLSFISVLFWTFIIGPLGAILSIPLTLLVRAIVLENDPRMAWLRWLSGDGQAREGR